MAVDGPLDDSCSTFYFSSTNKGAPSTSDDFRESGRKVYQIHTAFFRIFRPMKPVDPVTCEAGGTRAVGVMSFLLPKRGFWSLAQRVWELVKFRELLRSRLAYFRRSPERCQAFVQKACGVYLQLLEYLENPTSGQVEQLTKQLVSERKEVKSDIAFVKDRLTSLRKRRVTSW